MAADSIGKCHLYKLVETRFFAVSRIGDFRQRHEFYSPNLSDLWPRLEASGECR